MSRNHNATHSHKTQGAVVLLKSTAQLGKVLVLNRDDEIWVKLADLTEDAQAISKKHTRKSSAGVHANGFS
jgi:hypothetical protein